MGWFTTQSGGDPLNVSTTVATADAHTLYARWEAKKATVRFDPNYPDGAVLPSATPTPTPLPVTYDKAYGTLPTPIALNEYTFEGWFTEKTGGTQVRDSDIFLLGVTAQTLYAQWAKSKYVVTLDYGTDSFGTPMEPGDDSNARRPAHLFYAIPATPDPGTPANPDDAAPLAYAAYGPLPSPTAAGHTFGGWFTVASPSPSTTPVPSSATVTGDHTLYAQWVPEKHTVTFDLNYSPVPSSAPTPAVVDYNAPLLSLAPTPARDGYRFDGWYLHEGQNGQNQRPVTAAMKVTADITVTAHWTPINTVRLELGGGTLPENSPTSIVATVGQKYPTLPTPTRAGYRFAGWYTGEADGVYVSSGSDVGDTVPAALYARWTAIRFTVQFDYNGITGKQEPKTYTYGEKYGNLPTNARWDGHTFLGWYTQASGGDRVTTESTVSIAENHTLYAHWGFKVSFDSTTGTGDMEDDIALVGDDYILPECSFTPPGGMIFYRWAVGSTRGEQLPAGARQAIVRNTTLYAVWREAPVHVTATCTVGGSLTTTDGGSNYLTFERNSDVTFIARPNRGYELVELVIDGVSGYAQSYTFRSMTEDHTIHAVFRRIPAPAYTACDHGLKCPLIKFRDLNPNAWYHDAVHYCMDEVIMTGISETTYSPGALADRATIAKVLWQAAGCPNAIGFGTISRPFKDVPATKWYYHPVIWAAKEGIVTGYNSDRFGPTDSVTREQLVTMLWRYAGSPKPSPYTRLPYYDSWNISSYAWDAVCWATENGILNGRGNGILDPKGTATRAEVAKVIMEYNLLIADE